MNKFSLKKIPFKVFTVIIVFSLIALIMIAFFDNTLSLPINLETSSKESFALFNDSENNQRLCANEGINFNCTSLFLSQYQTKEDIKRKAKYLYLKGSPSLINIKGFELKFTPDNYRNNYTLNSIEVQTFGKIIHLRTITNDITKTSAFINENTIYQGFNIFSYKNFNLDDGAIDTITIKGLTTGKLVVKFIDNDNNVVAIEKITSINNKDTIIAPSKATFIKNVGYGKILPTTFNDKSVRISRYLLNGKELTYPSSIEKYSDIATNGIVLDSFGEWIIEIEAIGGDFQNIQINAEGIYNLEAVIATSASKNLKDVFASKAVKRINNNKIIFDLNDDYFIMNSLFKPEVKFTKNVDIFLNEIWDDLSPITLAISIPIVAKYEFDNFLDVKLDLLSIPYLSLDIKVNNKEETSNINTLFQIFTNSANIKRLNLEGVFIGNGTSFTADISLTLLNLQNASITNTNWLNRLADHLPDLTSLNLSNNNLKNDSLIFNNLKSLYLTKLNLSHTNINGTSFVAYVTNNTLYPIDTSLVHLDLSNNQYDTFPSFSRHFSSLKDLNMGNNLIVNFGFLRSLSLPLTTLDLSNNKIVNNRLPQLSNTTSTSIENLLYQNNIDLIPKFIDEEADYPNLKVLNLSNTKINSDVYNSFNYFTPTSLETLDLSHNDLSFLTNSLLKNFLIQLNNIKLNISNTNLSNYQLKIIIAEDIAPKLVELNLSSNSQIAKLPTFVDTSYSKLKKLNISETAIDSLFEINSLEELVANNLLSFTFETVQKYANIKYSFKNSTISFFTYDKSKPNLPIFIDNSNIDLGQRNFYNLIAAKISPFDVFVKAVEKKYNFDINEDRKEKGLDPLENNDLDWNLLEPKAYYQQLALRYANNTIDYDYKLTDKLKEETKTLLDTNSYSEDKYKKLKSEFNLSFENYGLHWSKSYLAAITLAPIMIVLFSLINVFIAYQYKIQKRNRKKRKEVANED